MIKNITVGVVINSTGVVQTHQWTTIQTVTICH